MTATADHRLASAASERFLARLEQLCACDSPTGDVEAVDAAAHLLGEWAADDGCDVDAFPTTGGLHLRATLRGAGAGRILLLGHHDTVWPRGTAAARPVVVEGARALGPGVADMKGGLLVGLAAMARLARGPRAGFGAVELHSLPDEEARTGAPERIDLLAHADAALVLECGRESGAIVSSRDAAAWVVLRADGRGAHAGQDAARGHSALHAAIAEVARIEQLDGARVGLRVRATRLVSDGPGNAIARVAEATVDVRARSNETLAWALEQASRTDDHPGVTVTSSSLPGFPAMQRCEPLVCLARDELAHAGAPVAEAHAGGASDACWTSSLGIPSVDGLGPIGGDDHTEREWIDLRSVEGRVAAVAGLCAAATALARKRREDARH